MIYLASPYSHPDPLIVQTRFLLAEQVTATLIKRGVYVWSPIVHSHEMARRHTLPTDAAYWAAWSRDFIRRCDRVYVLKITGWDESRGVTAEVDFARDCNVPVFFVDEDGDMV